MHIFVDAVRFPLSTYSSLPAQEHVYIFGAFIDHGKQSSGMPFYLKPIPFY
jgi:hypothetical protein